MSLSSLALILLGALAFYLAVAWWIDHLYKPERTSHARSPMWVRFRAPSDAYLARIPELATFSAPQRKYLWVRAREEFHRDHFWLNLIPVFLPMLVQLQVNFQRREIGEALAPILRTIPIVRSIPVDILLMILIVGFALTVWSFFLRFTSGAVRRRLDHVIRHDRVRPDESLADATVAGNS